MSTSHSRAGTGRWLLPVLVLLLAPAALLGSSLPSPVPGPAAGIVTLRSLTAEDLGQLGTVWYYTYGFEGDSDGHHHRVLLVSPHFDEQRLAEAVRGAPGRWWMVGNEPNDPYQDDLSPAAYAVFYHRAQSIITREDPTARIMLAGIANADWRWAEDFREAYHGLFGRYPRIDAWNVHGYVLDATSDQLDLRTFRQQLIDFRAWMDRIGEGDKALVLSEFGVLMGQDPANARYVEPVAVQAYIGEAVAWLRATDYVQAYAWFADYTEGAFNGDLYMRDGSLSVYGQAYQEAIAEREPISGEGAGSER